MIIIFSVFILEVTTYHAISYQLMEEHIFVPKCYHYSVFHVHVHSIHLILIFRQLPYPNSKWDWLLTQRLKSCIYSLIINCRAALNHIYISSVFIEMNWIYIYKSQIICLMKWYYWIQYREDFGPMLKWTTVMKLFAAWILKLTSNN